MEASNTVTLKNATVTVEGEERVVMGVDKWSTVKALRIIVKCGDKLIEYTASGKFHSATRLLTPEETLAELAKE